jgi:Uma2 family endonuclease
MTWEEILADKTLANLPFRIESDRWGNIVMSPPPRRRHGEYQLEIGHQLRILLPGGFTSTECPIRTSEGVKAADVAWCSKARAGSKKNDPVYLIAPEICVEVESPSNSEAELAERRRLYFEKGADEVWICDLYGRMAFYDPTEEIDRSRICPKFPIQVRLPDTPPKRLIRKRKR